MAQLKTLKGKLFDTVCEEKLAFGLGCFSIGLGLAELLTPNVVAAICGVEKKNSPLIRLFGIRELQAGAVIFSQGKKPAEGMWLRVMGDALDLTALGVAALSPKSCKVRLSLATLNVLAVTALDILTAERLGQSRGYITEEGSIRVCKSVFVNKSPQECYDFWHNFENFPSFMRHVKSVSISENGRSQWVAKGPGGSRVAWEAETLEDVPNEMIVWRSIPGSLVSNRGSVKFEAAPGGRGTFVIVDLEYAPPAGMLGVGIAKLFREEPEMQLNDDLRRFKQIMEVGEIVCSNGSPDGYGRMKQHPGQPLAR
jgi:uncharacterized membrane protein